MKIPEMSSLGGSQITGEVCIPNISTAERRKRLASGVVMFIISLVILAALMALGASRWWRLLVMFIISLVILAALMALGASRWWRLLLLPLFMGASSGFFQWRDKT
jgi:hypothetical protein